MKEGTNLCKEFNNFIKIKFILQKNNLHFHALVARQIWGRQFQGLLQMY